MRGAEAPLVLGVNVIRDMDAAVADCALGAFFRIHDVRDANVFRLYASVEIAGLLPAGVAQPRPV